MGSSPLIQLGTRVVFGSCGRKKRSKSLCYQQRSKRSTPLVRYVTLTQASLFLLFMLALIWLRENSCGLTYIKQPNFINFPAYYQRTSIRFFMARKNFGVGWLILTEPLSLKIVWMPTIFWALVSLGLNLLCLTEDKFQTWFWNVQIDALQTLSEECFSLKHQ